MTIQTALTALDPVLGDRLSRSKSDLALHGASESHFPPHPPDAVAYPRSTEEVARIVGLCAAHGCPVVAWGRGTSLEGHTAALNGGLCIDFSRMDQVLKVQPEDMLVTVQPGITREALDIALRDTGLFFPVDPGADATIGGMAATRASGTTAVRYGTMRDNVRALEVVLADGRVIRTGSGAKKSSAGYDLTGLFVGSEGTLGLITELTLRLYGRPEAVSATVCGFAAIGPAVEAVTATIQSGIVPARIEFVDAATARAFNAYAKAGLDEVPHLLVEFHGRPRQVEDEAAAFEEIARDFGAVSFQAATRPEERKALWALRHNAYYAVMGLRPGARALVTDICVPISRLAEAVEETVADIEAAPFPGPIVGHVGDGNFHAALLIEDGNAAELDAALEISDRMVSRALRLGGTATGEHGVGMGKLRYMTREHGEGWQVMADLKRTLDPGNILNPGKVVRIG